MMVIVSIIVPVHNAENFLHDSFNSIINQTWKDGIIEVSIFNDCSTDSSARIIQEWCSKFAENNIKVVYSENESNEPGGVGYAKNNCILQCTGEYLCFLDADDIMDKNRIKEQLKVAQTDDRLIVGSCYERLPHGSTQRYTEWSNSLAPSQLYLQIYTSFGPTIINPTWFCSRSVFHNNLFLEYKKGYPEDLEFFYRHLRYGGRLYKVDQTLLIYRFHETAASFSVSSETIFELRVKELERNILPKWTSFTIWNAGKQGRKLFRSLKDGNKRKVSCLCDVDTNKISKGFYTCELVIDETTGKPFKVPIVHFSNANPPFIICMKINLTGGAFESNLNSLNLVEGEDFYHFN